MTTAHGVCLPLTVFLALLMTAGSPSSAGALDDVDFERHIAPILRARCLTCHAEKASGGLRLETRSTLLTGGDSGPAIVAGNSAKSALLARVTAAADDDERMPPEGPRLNGDQIARLKQWIDAGAQWPERLVLKSPKAAAAAHWAFRPVTRVAPPAVAEPQRLRNEIDAFVAARLDAAGIRPAPDAERLTLLRRVTLDLTGLPPTPHDVDDFLADDQPDSYERVVDRLLASPHYGERWARPWLDLCHYADTDGYLTDQIRPVAWRYRTWLIDALNRDLPFDRFTIEQLAGDLLSGATIEQRLATGFLRNTLSNREGGADLEEYRVEQIVDRTAMVGTGWLGLTVGCARCHDHKFDPLSQREFFGLYGFLDQGDELNIDAPLPGEAAAFAADYEPYRRRRDELIAPQRAEIEALQARWEKKMLDAVAAPAVEPIWDRQWEVLGLIWGGHFGEGQLEGCVIVRTPVSERTQDEKDRLLDYFLTHGALIDGPKFNELKLGELKGKLDSLKKEVHWPTRAPTMRQSRQPRPVLLHVRGDFRVPGDAVGPAVPAWLGARGPSAGGLNAAGIPAAEGGRPATRLDLARWLVAADNPLTPRVVVNRMWQEFFGRGLVDPPDDFGMRGQPPSHPELLDWLAGEFVRRAWSVKQMHRLIVTSATYCQSSKARPELEGRDPHNRLLARQIPLRLSADQVRDTALAVSGLIDRRVGGASVFPQQPDSVAKEGFRNEWKTSEGADRCRRGLYTWLQRLSPFAHNVTFDAPPSNSICSRRDRTNSPLQALTLLNDAAFFDAARALARQTVAESAANDADRIAALIRRTLARPATSSEIGHLQSFLNDQRQLLRESPADVAKLASQPAPATAPDELAAWTAVCSVVLNLHEFITRD
ncbi:MAG: PSD1 domain-containing protein [Planctomycetia bacterium]|nr:PSD1 domain-containing protein [Planctomycetia bacterium]